MSSLLCNKGSGKIILFGEHFVVYGMPAIVSAVEHAIEATVHPNNSYKLIDNTKKLSNTTPITWAESKQAITAMLTHLNINNPLHITIKSNLALPSGGLGISAASLVAIARAVNNCFFLGLTNEQINEAAYVGEKEHHGTPSGIDNTAATYGGMFVFERGKRKTIGLRNNIDVVLIDSGIRVNTKEVVADVKKLEAALPSSQYKKIFSQAHDALHKYDLKALGELMNENHTLLQQITASSNIIDNIVSIARDAGAWGAKLTGAGRGGLAIALTPGKALQTQVAQTLKNHGLATCATSLGTSVMGR